MAKKYRVDLKTDEREILSGLIASGTQRVRKINHAHILLSADAGWTDQQISAAPNVSVPTIERVRQHFVEEGLQQVFESVQNQPKVFALDGWRSRSPPAGSGLPPTASRASTLESAVVGQRDGSA